MSQDYNPDQHVNVRDVIEEVWLTLSVKLGRRAERASPWDTHRKTLLILNYIIQIIIMIIIMITSFD